MSTGNANKSNVNRNECSRSIFRSVSKNRIDFEWRTATHSANTIQPANNNHNNSAMKRDLQREPADFGRF